MTQESIFTQPEQNEPPDSDQTAIKELLAVGKKAKAKQYHTLLSRIKAGEVLNVTEQKVFDILEEELKKTTGEAGQGATPENSLKNRLEVFRYLEKRGWDVSKSAVYNHVTEGKLRAREKGRFAIADVERYAQAHLQLKDQAGVNAELEKLQRERSSGEARKATAQAVWWEQRTAIVKNQYLPRELVEQEQAAKAALLNSDIEEWFYANVAAMIAIVGGDPERAPDLIEFLIEAKEKWMARYSEDREFQVDESAYEKLFKQQAPEPGMMDPEDAEDLEAEA
jgi:hypothetical protein